MKYEVYNAGGLLQFDWRWRLRASNNYIIAVSSEGYKNMKDCVHAMNLVMSTSAFTPVIYK